VAIVKKLREKMNRFSNLIIKYRKIILIMTAVIFALSAFGIYYFIYDDRINSDMLEYLPPDTPTSEGIEFLKKHFGVKGDAFVVVEGEKEDAELEQGVERLKKIKGLSQFFWVGDLKEIKAIEDLLALPIFSNVNVKIETQGLYDYLKQPINPQDPNTKYNYVILMLFDYSPSTQEAFQVINTVYKEFSNRNVGVAGMTAMAKQVMEETMAELIYYIVFAVLCVSVILLIATSSYFEPLILISTLLISVIVNLGTNLIFPSVSIISFASSSVLQLGIAMDYAIFFMHAYKEQRKLLEPIDAAKSAIPKVFVAILASSLTTMGGFAALAFMNFRLGADLTKVVTKGILLSFLTVVFLQPIFVIIFDKALTKTAHKELMINFEKVSTFTVKWRKVIIAIAILAIIPAYIMQSNVDFSYLKIYKEPYNMTPQEMRAKELGNQVITAVPLKTKEGGHKDYIAELITDDKITNVIGAYSVMDISPKNMEKLLNLFGDGFQEGKMGAMGTLFRKVDGEWYTLYLIEIEGDTEDEKASRTHSHLVKTTNKYFEKNYPLGILTGTFDMAAITPSDFLKVSAISVLIILIIMSILLKSFWESLVMVVLIELAIWLNISLNFIFSANMNFMVYIIIGSVQLGCTVDYAILMATRFEQAKSQYPDTKTAAIKASASVFPAITASASIIMAACLAVIFVTNNLLVREMAFVLARGAFISYVLVSIVLPPLLVYFKKSNRPKKKENLA